jgi:Fe-S cluster biogenesis protein NfuA
MDLGFRMHAERTPNPDSIKWVLGEPLLESGRSAHFSEPVEPATSPLAARLFAVDGVVAVFVAANFITVTKRSEIEWPDLAQPLVDAIREFVDAGEEPLGPEYQPLQQGPSGDVVVRIQEILDQEIRPAVAMDGGDIIFAGYRDGVVELYMQGACQGCPSSTLTLKMGIRRWAVARRRGLRRDPGEASQRPRRPPDAQRRYEESACRGGKEGSFAPERGACCCGAGSRCSCWPSAWSSGWTPGCDRLARKLLR